jgi:hypothetical protein
MTTCRQIRPLLPRLPDSDLNPGEARLLEAHLAACATCRHEAAAFTRLPELLSEASLPPPRLPAGDQVATWIMEQEASRLPMSGGSNPAFRYPNWPIEHRGWGVGAALAVLLAAALLSVQLPVPDLRLPAAMDRARVAGHPIHPRRGHPKPQQRAAWRVARLAGTPVVGIAPVRTTGRLTVGEWLETDRSSRAQIDVADIGRVEVEPNSRIRLLETRAAAHRLRLERGGVRAKINAPPRLFFVETPSAVAVDLGCSYTLRVDNAGRGVLQVNSGWVELAHNGREAIVPQGALCQTRPGIGPGTPYFADAPAALQTALAELDFANGGSRALSTVLATARRRDSLTLWHLLPRVFEAERDRVYDRLKRLTPPPADVTRQGIRRLDPTLMRLWREKIEDNFWREEWRRSEEWQ